jgi:two-component system response regulator HydG
VSSRILIVDDDVDSATALLAYLSGEGFACDVAESGFAALLAVERTPFDAVVCDMQMEGMNGLDLIDRLHGMHPGLPVVVITGHESIDGAVDAIRHGAANYLPKRGGPERIAEALGGMPQATRDLQRPYRAAQGPDELIGSSARMSALRDDIARVAKTSSSVLIVGESGTGKELIARSIHAQSARADRPFVAVNTSAIPEALLESELFGHARGAFTGASQQRRGLFVEADGGTMLLDEIGDMPLGLQAKFLRVLQRGEVRPIGGDKPRTVDVRILAATNRDLTALMREKLFREDLFFRLNVITIAAPALREHREDIPELAWAFLDQARRRAPASPVRGISQAALELLARPSWRGNVRELASAIERVVVMSQDEIISPHHFAFLNAAAPAATAWAAARRELWTLRRLSESYVQWVLAETGGNKVETARILGVNLSTLYRWERRHP